VIVIVTLALGGAAIFGNVGGLLGMAMGLAGAAVGVVGLILATRLAGAAATAGAKPGLGVFLTIVVFAAKIPLYYVLWTLSQSFGGSAPGCFLAGVVLVYFCLVAWAVSR
jgi:hypothetical protein